MIRCPVAGVLVVAFAQGLLAQDLPSIPILPQNLPTPTVLPPPKPVAPQVPTAPAIAVPSEPITVAPVVVVQPPPSVPSTAPSTLPVQTESKKEEAKKDEAKKEETDSTPSYWVVGDQLDMTARWNHGLWFETSDKAFRFHPVGRMHINGAWMKASDRTQFGDGGVGRVDDGVAIRRLRVGVQGTIWEVIDFWIEPDFFNTYNTQGPNEDDIIGNTSATTDVWVQVTHLPWVGNLRFGSVKPAQSMEHTNSSRFLDFMERSLMFDAFVGGVDNGFQPGFLLHRTFLDQRAVLQASITHNQANAFGYNVGDGEYHYAARGTYLPVFRADGRELVHVGLSYSHRQLDDRQVRFRARTLIRNGPSALTTRLADLRLAGVAQDTLSPEFAMVIGPFHMQTEYLATWVQDVTFPISGPTATPRGQAFFQGYYIQALYFLTGEHRRYNRRTGAFARVIPHENFFLVRGEDGCLARGLGAWQIGARYSFLDLNDQGIGGGIIHDLTLGLNWFWNPNMKWQFNYSVARRDIPGAVGNGIVQGFGARFAMDF